MRVGPGVEYVRHLLERQRPPRRSFLCSKPLGHSAPAFISRAAKRRILRISGKMDVQVSLDWDHGPKSVCWIMQVISWMFSVMSTMRRAVRNKHAAGPAPGVKDVFPTPPPTCRRGPGKPGSRGPGSVGSPWLRADLWPSHSLSSSVFLSDLTVDLSLTARTTRRLHF